MCTSTPATGELWFELSLLWAAAPHFNSRTCTAGGAHAACAARRLLLFTLPAATGFRLPVGLQLFFCFGLCSLKKMVRNEGALSLYRGVVAPLLGNMVSKGQCCLQRNLAAAAHCACLLQLIAGLPSIAGNASHCRCAGRLGSTAANCLAAAISIADQPWPPSPSLQVLLGIHFPTFSNTRKWLETVVSALPLLQSIDVVASSKCVQRWLSLHD